MARARRLLARPEVDERASKAATERGAAHGSLALPTAATASEVRDFSVRALALELQLHAAGCVACQAGATGGRAGRAPADGLEGRGLPRAGQAGDPRVQMHAGGQEGLNAVGKAVVYISGIQATRRLTAKPKERGVVSQGGCPMAPRAWPWIYARLLKVPSQRRWGRRRGTMASLMPALWEAGWAPRSAASWADPRVAEWAALPAAELNDPTDVIYSAAADTAIKLWRKAARGHGAGDLRGQLGAWHAGCPFRTAKDQGPERKRALELQRALERALTTFTGHWIEDPQVLDDDRDALHWRRHCVPYVAHYLSHPAMAPLVHERTQQDGHGNVATAQLDMAMEICDQAFIQRRSYRMRYWAWLRMLESRDYDERVRQLAEHAEAITRELEAQGQHMQELQSSSEAVQRTIASSDLASGASCARLEQRLAEAESQCGYVTSKLEEVQDRVVLLSEELNKLWLATASASADSTGGAPAGGCGAFLRGAFGCEALLLGDCDGCPRACCAALSRHAAALLSQARDYKVMGLSSGCGALGPVAVILIVARRHTDVITRCLLLVVGGACILAGVVVDLWVVAGCVVYPAGFMMSGVLVSLAFFIGRGVVGGRTDWPQVSLGACGASTVVFAAGAAHRRWMPLLCALRVMCASTAKEGPATTSVEQILAITA
ncbi:unnamed protein product [Prorocentrum cordatum]|uniref:Uncharacterized protein n=1 Tax=Prorocentrum cordatum TaxID=2364126 RepID=A0ABN9SJJ9_9DINO|nr:unnamed protein product [Polarella glacialis]